MVQLALARLFLDHLTISAEDGNLFPLLDSTAESLASIDGSDSSRVTATQSEIAREAVFLGTVHQAKGLEWATVFVVRMNEVRMAGRPCNMISG